MSAYKQVTNYFQDPTWCKKLADYENRVPPDKTNQNDSKIDSKTICLKSVGNCWFLYPHSTLSLWGLSVTSETYIVMEGRIQLTM